MNTVTVKNLTLGDGIPKIAVPLVAEDSDGLKAALADIRRADFDILEFRADFFKEARNADYIIERLRETRQALPDTPLLFTFRRAEEGGSCPMPESAYFNLIQTAISSGLIDMIDIELFAAADQVKETVAIAKAQGIAVLMCNHDFDNTPPKAEIIGRLKTMQDWGADICKIAVMPHSPADVLVLLDATQTMFQEYAVQPLVTISMGKLGIISRLAGATFGSAITFGTAGKASAPGQIGADDLRFILNTLSGEH
ncbi:type I 3-dehydroquinate dehydratase [Neisseria montereyensis]|uniref:3-dehydroquinate dehydratase n=1 Tax=Neisseria montereyensis TaxID=2973938 RepID=A0ABT2FEK9_9NEIS|nr:type I 3-dehydroquinate dehydratase [Neisseria montereyensis]MCS4534628.1 type I 3-dehydroquinate dehydratase [Neisseria montereyensis]